MRLLHSPGVRFIEGHVLVCPFLLERRYHMDAIHLSLAYFLEDLNDPLVKGPLVIVFISPITS